MAVSVVPRAASLFLERRAAFPFPSGAPPPIIGRTMPYAVVIPTSLALLLCLLPAAAAADWGPGENGVIFSEVHYHPPGDAAGEEFVELHNAGARWVDLSGWTISGGIEFTFPPGQVIAPGGHLAVARDAKALKARPDAGEVIGNFKGRLDNRGEILELKNRTGRTIAWLHYRDGKGREGGLWPEKPDGGGPSLELIRAASDWDHPWSWAASRVAGGTPGRPNSVAAGAREAEPADASRTSRRTAPAETLPRINEVAWGGPDVFVELHHDGRAAVKLDGLRLAAPGVESGFALSGSLPPRKPQRFGGDELAALLAKRPKALLLLTSRGEIADSLAIPAKLPEGASAGRYPDGGREVFSYARPSPGKANPAPSLARVVINEILYHGASESSGDEFVEIHNPGKSDLPAAGWKLDRGVEFEFPEGTVLPAGGYLVVAKDPEKIRARLTPAEGKNVIGPFKGKLSNRGDTLVLLDELGNALDRVSYSDRPPWPRDADGRGFSLELLNPDLDNRWAAAWGVGTLGGTPGKKNSRAVPSLPPVVAKVRHEPAVPAPGDTVTIYAHIVASRRISEASVVYRELTGNSAPVKKRLSAPEEVGSLDDGDGLLAAKIVLPSRLPEGALLGFRIAVRDASGRTVQSPEGDREYLIGIDKPDRSFPNLPLYRILMAPADWQRMTQEARGSGKNWYPCAFVASVHGDAVNEHAGRAYQGAQIRFRGMTSRRPRDGRMSYRLKLAPGDFFDGRDRLVLNAYASFRQKAGGDIMRMAGLPVSRALSIRLKTPGFDDPGYVDVEVVDGNFIAGRYGSGSGDIFRGDHHVSNPRFVADLSYNGENVDDYLAVYQRANNKKSRDIANLLELLKALAASDADGYVERVRKLVDVEEWAMYFAANNVLGNTEGNLTLEQGDDYFLHQRASDGRWVLIPWDQDSTFDDASMPLFRPRLPAVRRFLRHPEFAPYYHRAARELIDGPLAGPSFFARARELETVFPADDVRRLEAFVRTRQIILREHYPLWPQAGIRPAGSGATAGRERGLTQPEAAGGFGSRLFLAGMGPRVTLWGYAEPGRARGVKIGNARAQLEPVSGEWSLEVEAAGASTPFWVDLLDGAGRRFDSYSIAVDRVPAIRRLPAVIGSHQSFDADGGPLLLEGVVTVAAGASLRLSSGVEVVCGPDALLAVRGRLLVEGTPERPVSFRMGDWRRPWQGIWFQQTGSGAASEHVLSGCRFEGGGGQQATLQPVRAVQQGQAVVVRARSGVDIDSAPFLNVVEGRLRLKDCLFRGIRGAAVAGRASILDLRGITIVDGRHGVLADDSEIELHESRFQRLSGQGLLARGIRRKGSQVTGSKFREIQGPAIQVIGSQLRLEGVSVSASEVGLDLRGGSRVEGAGLTLAANAAGVALDRDLPGGLDGAGAAGRSELVLSRSILCPNGVELLAGRGSKIQLDDCRLAQRTAPAQAVARNTVWGELEFEDPLRGDFRPRQGRQETAALEGRAARDPGPPR
jgi:hypothetical protein